MAERRFPRPDGDFSAYMNHYSEAVEKFYNVQGLDPNDLTDLKKALDLWNANYPAHVAAQQRAEAARQNKDAARRDLEAQARPITNFIQGFPKTTDADRATIGITVRDRDGTPVTTPTTRPQAVVQAGQRLTHTLRLTDESTPTRRARPRGVLGAEVWVKLVDAGQPAPTDPAALAFLTMATKPSVTAEYRAADGGKTAVYMLRWVSTRGEKGPWSDVTTATVAA
ncbi:MAG: hypothetical protein AB7Q00_08960 [Phycisphaerales bacterium]